MSAEPPPATASDPVVAAAWQRLEEAWAEEDRHDRFLALCRERGVLGEGAGLYRAAAGERDEAGEPTARARVAKSRLDRIVALALAELAARPAPEPLVAHRTIQWAAFFVFLVMLTLVGWALRPRG